MTTGIDTSTTSPTEAPKPSDAPARRLRVPRALGFRNIGAVYVWLLIVVVFAIWVPSTFLTWATVRQILDGNAVTGMLALSLIIPLSARVFDLSIGYTATLSGVITAHFLARGVGVPESIAIAMVASVLVGIMNGTIVVVMGVDSFIGTLASGLLIASFITIVTKDIPITASQLSGSFQNVGQKSILSGITLPVVYMLAIAVGLWAVQEHTVTGRRLYATGFNQDAARLAGIKTDRLRFISLIVSATIAGAAGVVLASTISSGDPTAGTDYLLPAFTCAFLGATQLRGGRFNAWGTLIAVLLLGTGIAGLGLASAPTWAPNMFTGLVLIVALAITGAQRRVLHSGLRRRFTKRDPALITAVTAEPPPASATPTKEGEEA